MSYKILRESLPPEIAFNQDLIEEYAAKKLGLNSADNAYTRILRRSIDARKKNIRVNVELGVWINEKPVPRIQYVPGYKNVGNSVPAIIVGAGPAGLFAALRLIELGIKPVVLERGKDVQSRRRDLAAINRHSVVNPDSNYCFGEGGAGTYSDGKLYTRSTKRGDVRRILEILYFHGAREEILIDAHPHIGTNKLPALVKQLRETILEHGGEILFNTRVTDLILHNGQIKGVKAGADKYESKGVILATGHSARDIFHLLYRKGILIEEKPFAMGVRIEHPQEMIDKIQYHGQPRGEYLPAAAYSLAAQTLLQGKQRGAFSFCMCPGGFIVPAATAPGEVVVNGMSPSKRDSPFANSGMVISIEKDDVLPYHDKFGPLAAMHMQQEWEQKACLLAGGTQKAPAQRLMDFLAGKASSSLPDTSYIPGLASVSMDELLPAAYAERLRQAFKIFGKTLKGYLSNEAQLVGVESRTSSPVRIPREKDSLQHPQIKGLFPCAEGSGYAGGIVSAAMDGEKCAEALARTII